MEVNYLYPDAALSPLNISKKKPTKKSKCSSSVDPMLRNVFKGNNPNVNNRV